MTPHQGREPDEKIFVTPAMFAEGELEIISYDRDSEGSEEALIRILRAIFGAKIIFVHECGELDADM